MFPFHSSCHNQFLSSNSVDNYLAGGIASNVRDHGYLSCILNFAILIIVCVC